MNKFIIAFTFFLSMQFNAQTSDLELNAKITSYKHLDNFNLESEKYKTKLIEGSGFLKDKKEKNIGNVSFETLISRDSQQKLIRLFDRQIFFYTFNNSELMIETTIYFDENEKPDLAKIVSEETIGNSRKGKEVKFFDLKNIDFNKSDLNLDEKRIRLLLQQM